MSTAMSNTCVLVIEHDGKQYTGSVLFNTRERTAQMAAFFASQIDRSIQQIAESDVSDLV
jgi:hypothetical protein